jgi:hypothetical protein
MPKLIDMPSGDVLLTLLKGENGTGKSIMAISYALSGPMYVFDFEDRMRSVANYYRQIKRLDVIQNVEYDTYYSFLKLRQKFQSLEQNSKGVKNVVMDSLTSFTDRALSNTKQFKGKEQETSGQNVGRTVGEFRVNTMDDFNAESAAIQEFIIEHALILKSRGINFIVTAHVIKVKEESDEGAGKTTIARYLMTGGKKAGQKIPGYYDEIYHTNIEPAMSANLPPSYTIRTRHSGNDFAKTSLNLPYKIDFTNKVFYEELKKYIPVQKVPDITKGELIVPSKKLDMEILTGEKED